MLVSATRQILNSWKEIACYMGRGVRTVQRYERLHGLPVRRPTRTDRSSVMSFSDEIDVWLGNTPTRPMGYVRPVLLMLAGAVEGSLNSRRRSLEAARFNVLLALTIDEVLATADKFNVDGFVFDFTEDEGFAELCESLNSRFPRKPLFILAPASHSNGKSLKAHYIIPVDDPAGLVNAALAAFGSPRVG